MQSRTFIIYLLVLVVAFMGAYIARDVTAEAPKTNGKIGFINLKTIFKEYNKVKELQSKIDQEHRVEIAKIKELEEEVQALRQEIPLYLQGSAIRKRKEKELANKAFEIESRKKRANFFRIENLKSGITAIYKDISDVVEKHAKARGYFMIIKVSEPDFFGTANYEALQLEINLRDVLYYNQKHDVTQVILKELNKP